MSTATDFNGAVAQAYNETFKLRIISGRALLAPELRASPENAAAILVANYQDFLTLALQQNHTEYEALVAAQEKRLQKLTRLKPHTAWSDYSIAEVRLHLAISKLLADNKLAAAWEFRKAFLQFEANAKRYPNFHPNLKSLGAMQVLIGSIPDNYRWFFNIIGMHGSIPKGMANLRIAATNPNPFQEEASLLQLVLQQILDQREDSTKAATINQFLRNKPDNLLYTFVGMYLLKKIKHSEDALKAYQSRPEGDAYLKFPYLEHMAADIYLWKGDLGKSIQMNKLFLAQHTGIHHIKAANFKLYLAYCLAGNKQLANHYRQQTRENGLTAVDEDNYAANFVSQDKSPDRALLTARLRSDGGYYEEAMKELEKLKLSKETPPEVRAEYMYRKARIYHGLKEFNQAKEFYEYTINISKADKLYFAPNAALQLGYIYLEEKNKVKARVYFRAALNYKGHPYKNSIDSKAKLALASL